MLGGCSVDNSIVEGNDDTAVWINIVTLMLVENIVDNGY